MNTPNESDLIDEALFPTGIWTGFFTEPHHTRRGWMHLYLTFENGQIRGEGTDYVGPWKIQGEFDRAQSACQWTKHYLGRHRVIYRGVCGSNGIVGRWSINEGLTGDFHIWPAANSEVHEMYADEF